MDSLFRNPAITTAPHQAESCPIFPPGVLSAAAAPLAPKRPSRPPNDFPPPGPARMVSAPVTLTQLAMVDRRPVGVRRQSVRPQRASWDRAGNPSQVKLARCLAHVDAIAGPVLATVSSRVAAELIVGFSDGVSLIDGGHDLDNYLFPVAQRLGPERGAAIFARKIPGPSPLAVSPP